MTDINAMDLISPTELHEFVQELLDKHGETEEQLMTLLFKITTAKAILEHALGLEEPLYATLEGDDDDSSTND